MQLGVTHPSRHHLLHEYQNCSFLKVAYIFLSVLFQQKDGKNFYHFLFYQTNHSHVQSNIGKALNHHSMQLGVTQSNHYHLLHEYKKSTPPRIFSLEFFRIFQNNYSNIFERLHLQNRKTIRRPSQIISDRSAVRGGVLFQLKLKQNTPPRIFPRNFL